MKTYLLFCVLLIIYCGKIVSAQTTPYPSREEEKEYTEVEGEERGEERGEEKGEEKGEEAGEEDGEEVREEIKVVAVIKASDEVLAECPENEYEYLGACYETCPEGTWNNEVTKICENCVDYCKLCYNSISCQECDEGYYYNNDAYSCDRCPGDKVLIDGSCVDRPTCDDGEYFDDDTAKCHSCSENCELCTGPNDCTKCRTSWLGSDYAVYEGGCVKKLGCDDGTYPDYETRSCPSCADPNCEKCVGPEPADCTECKSSWFGADYTLYNDQCVKELDCDDGNYPDYDTGRCRRCADPHCETCLGPEYSDCTKCETSFFGDDYIFDGDTCVKK